MQLAQVLLVNNVPLPLLGGMQGNTRRFLLVVCVVQKLLELNGIIKYEEAIKIPGLLVELPFISADIIFCSHKWRSEMHPDDQQKTKFNQMKMLLTRKALRSVQFVWMDYFCVPQDDESLKQQAIDSFSLYVRCCKYFVILVGNEGDSTLLEYNNRGWCRLERFAALSPVNIMNSPISLKIYVHNANDDSFLEATKVSGAIPSGADELNPLQGNFRGDKNAAISRIAPALLDLCQEILAHPRDDHEEEVASFIMRQTEAFICTNAQQVVYKQPVYAEPVYVQQPTYVHQLSQEPVYVQQPVQQLLYVQHPAPVYAQQPTLVYIQQQVRTRRPVDHCQHFWCCVLWCGFWTPCWVIACIDGWCPQPCNSCENFGNK